MTFFLKQPDKQLHFAAGLMIAVFFAGVSRGNVLWVGLAPMAFGCLKELCDWLANCFYAARGREKPHSVELLDAVSTALPGWILAAIIYFWKNWN